MYNQNSDHQMTPRISFSNDFAESAQYSSRQQLIEPRLPLPSLQPSGSSDFEFSGVSNYSMMSADELFSKGRMLPFKSNVGQKATLRDELLAGEEEEDGGGVSFRPPKGSSSSTRWKVFWGRGRKSHVGSKKNDKIDEKTVNVTQTSSQEMMNEGEGSSSSSCREVEFRMH